MNIKKTDNKGQSLIEAVVALGVMVITLSAISIAVTTGISNSTFVKNQDLANKYSQEGMEYIRNAKANNINLTVDGGGVKLFTAGLNGTYCMDADNSFSTPLGSGCTVNISSMFKRQVEFQDNVVCDDDLTPQLAKKVIVTVFWSSPKCDPDDPVKGAFCHSAETISCFNSGTVVAP